MREVDGIKVAFVGEESYFESLLTPSMYSTARDTGADVVILLASGKQESDLADDDIRVALETIAYRTLP